MTVAYEQDWCFGRPSEEPKVEFTLEEAKAIQRMVDDLIGMYSRGAVRIEAEGFETIYMVKYRIEQAEKENADN